MFAVLCTLFSVAMDKYVTVTKVGKSRMSPSENSNAVAFGIRSSTPIPSSSTSTLLETSLLSEVTRLSEAEPQDSFSAELMEESATEEDQKKKEGTRQLKSMLVDLEK